VHLETSGSPVVDATGNLAGYRGADTDVTERAKAEEQLLIANFALQSSTTAVGMANLDGRITFVNDAFLQLWGYERAEDVLGSYISEFAMRGPEEGGIRAARSEHGYVGEGRAKRRDGSPLDVLIAVNVVKTDEGKMICTMASFIDITDRKRAEEEALAARRELLRTDRLLQMGELAASIAHELNQPLTSILSNARAAIRLIESDRIGMDELVEILQDIADDDKRAGLIIRSLRAIIKPEDSEREQIALNDAVREVVALFHSEAIIQRIQVETEFADSLPPVKADKVQFQQVLINLMMNAADSMQDSAAHRTIVIRTRLPANGGVMVAVRDFGTGIDENDITRIFDPFFSTKGSGLGMGLSLCRSIIESHGGRIWAENSSGGGATFYFTLPGAEQVTESGVPTDG